MASAKTVEPDLSEFVALSKTKRLRCGVACVLDQLPEEDAAKLRAALRDVAGIKHTAIVAWLGQRDIKLRSQTVSRHRHGECSCDG